ncbi:hypothetical protein [Campylobacter sp. JMF_08 NE1]|uniref:hypothetical protein n=1 Tax=Campylobacter sp. JMF_08 NE1 TaxID=2983821 RepID=UPI0022E9B690|nr:hypothetical protein [Campylobacter sp. JMF_08 NE1]MDA3048020.1 hypothetical protein [Campylobacter sp. JMF_08 NE1]
MIEQIYKDAITDKISKAEDASDAEIICVLSGEALDLEPLSWGVACTIAFVVGTALMFFQQVGKVGAFELIAIVFLLFKFLFSKFPKFLEFFIPKFFKFRLTYDFAVSKFELFGYDKIPNAVIFCVCKNEKIAHIVCGENISAKIDNSEFLQIVQEFCAQAKTANFGEAVSAGIDRLCALIMAKIPHEMGDKDEIKEKIVEIK